MKTELLRERYETIELVGRGGEGEVIRALDHVHDRQVALKIRSAPDDVARSRLLSEARVLLALPPHPGLPLVREDFFEDGRYVIVMDWIEGTDLEAVLEADGSPGLDPARAIGYLEQAAGALEHLHGHDPPVVHGDIKPANLVLTPSGRVVLVDFGLSSTPMDELQRAGTSGYVAPEVAAGLRPTAASDVYSLAATAVVLITGERVSEGAPSWGAIDPQLVPAFERIVRGNLSTDPEMRDTSATALVVRLRRWYGDELPRGTVTLVLVDLPDVEARLAEEWVSQVARKHRGDCVAAADDGPLLAAFASVHDGFDAGLELARGRQARVAAGTTEAEPRAGRYDHESTSSLTRLLEAAVRGEVLLDDVTMRAVDDRLPREIGLAEVTGMAGPGGWAVAAPGLTAPPRADACPYRGLIAFEPDDGDVFFGREEVVASILERLLDGGFLGVVGASGSGKSSLVRAGLIPAYRRTRDGKVAILTPGPDPSAALASLLSGGRPTLVVVDQFEELFTLCADAARRAQFVDELLALREGSTPIVAVVRADFYGRCADHPRLASAIAERQHLLGPMQSEELRRTIEKPARVAGLRFEPGVVDAMLADVEGEPGGLPLLSHALFETWVRRDGRVLTRAGYEAAGGVRGAIARTADDVFTSLGFAEQALVRHLFLQLTELGDSTEDTRRRVRLAELSRGDDGPRDASAVIERLVAARLLIVGDDSAEIAHEALIREWPRLRRWLAEDRGELLALRQVSTAARSWEQSGRDEGDLYRGARLEAALERTSDARLSDRERAFLEASRGAQDRELRAAQRRARRLRALLAVVAAALVVAVIAGLFALAQRASARHTATVAQAGRLAAQSREIAPQQPDLGLLLGLEADRLDDSVDSRSALLGALEHGSRIRAWLQGFDSPVNATAFSPNGRLLAAVTFDGTTLWDTKTWRRVGPALRSDQGDWSSVDFSPDGRTLAIAGGKGRVELWDVATRSERRELTDPAAAAARDRALAGVQFSPNGAVVAAGGQESNHVTLWDAATGRVIGRPIAVKPPGTGGAQWISFSPDSTRIAVPGAPGMVGIWEVETGRQLGRPLTIGTTEVDEATFARGGRMLIAGDDAGFVSFVDVRTGRPLRQPLSVGDKPADALALSPDERLVAAASYRGPVHVWDTKTGTPYGPPLTADTSPGNDVAFSPDGRTLVSAHLRSAVAWDLSGGHVIGTPLGRTSDVVTGVAFSSDGRLLVTGLLDGHTVVYDAVTRRVERRVEGGSRVTAVAVQRDGKLVAVGTVDGRVRLFDPETGAWSGSALVAGRGAVWQVAFSPDGRLLAVDLDPNGAGEGFFTQHRPGEVQLWDVRSRRRVGKVIAPRAGSVFSVAFNGEGTLLATGSYFHRLDLWDVSARSRHGRSMRVVDEGFPSVAFDPSGALLAAGGASGLVRVWRVGDQRPAFPPLAGHSGPVTGASFDPRALLLATTNEFGGTRLWDSVTGAPYGDELISEKPGSLEPNLKLAFLARNAFSPNGRLLATAGADTFAMVWEIDPAVWRERACAIVGRNLSRAEWRLYLPSGRPYRPTCPGWPSG